MITSGQTDAATTAFSASHPLVVAGRVAEQLTRRGRRRRHGVPLGDRAEPRGHRLGRDEHRREEADRPDEHLHRRGRPRAAEVQAEEDAEPEQREPQPEQQHDREGDLGRARRRVPADEQAAEHEHREAEGRRTEVGDRAAECHRGAPDRQRPEAVGDAALRVFGHRGHGRFEAEEHREREHAGQQEGDVVAAAGDLDRPAEEEPEHQDEHDVEREAEHDAPGLAHLVQRVAPRDEQALAQRVGATVAQVGRRGDGGAGGGHRAS